MSEGSEHRLLRELVTPALKLFVPTHVEGVFDAFGWMESDTVLWGVPLVDGKPRFDTTTSIDRADPKRLLFVMREECIYLPRELAQLHLFDMGFTADDWALSPCAIDEATDELYAHKKRARELLWIAADNIAAVFWGLHDWAHFHNHGAFELRAWTEHHCDQSALTWISMNRDLLGVTESDLTRLRAEVALNSESRFREEA